MQKLKVLLTGASGSFGKATLDLLLEEDKLEITAMALDTRKEKNILKPYLKKRKFKVIYGDIRDYQTAYQAVEQVDIILHLAALVSPAADKNPDLAMEINYGGTVNLLQAIQQQKRTKEVYFVYIGSVAQTGERMPPIHWGRVGDPIKPAIYDYYSLSKALAERSLIESEIDNWVSLRQTGIMSSAIVQIADPIVMLNPLDNVLEYVSDRDSSIMLRNLCVDLVNQELDPEFWGHIYNVGGGESCRSSTLDLYSGVFREIGIENMDGAFQPNWFATHNFHGQYYLDSDKLENHLHFRNDTIDYFYESFKNTYPLATKIGHLIKKLPGAQSFLKSIVAAVFKKQALRQGGTLNALKQDNKSFIDIHWGSFNNWIKLPARLKDYIPFNNWQDVVHIDHGYDENMPESELTLSDIKHAAKFRGGSCISSNMEKGNWQQKLSFNCAFGHTFKASPRLVLEGGHWCPHCESKSWNYQARAKKDPFFAQVWNPLHSSDEKEIAYPKLIKPRLSKLKAAPSPS